MDRMLRARSLLAAIACASIVTAAWQPADASAWSHACSTVDQSWAGIAQNSTLNVSGARVKIEYVDPTLCTGATGYMSFSSAWVGIVGYHPADYWGSDIYQIGLDTCQALQCASGATAGVPYYFYAFGSHESAQCGAEKIPYPVFLDDANGSDYWYQIVKSGSIYYAKIAGATRHSRNESGIDYCWGGVDGAQYMNEVRNIFDQSGGSVSDHQFFSSATWDNAGGSTFSVWRPYGTTCDFEDLSSQRCRIASNLHDSWYSWDTRQP